MISILVDTNVVLDVLLDREPHASQSVMLWANVESGRMRGFLAAHAVTTIHYLLRREQGEARTRKTVAAMLTVFSVAPVDAEILNEALTSASGDFEDAVTTAAAGRAKCDFIVTRDPRGFKGSPVKAIPPEAANALVAPPPQAPRSLKH